MLKSVRFFLGCRIQVMLFQKQQVDKLFCGFENKGFDETMYSKELSDMLGVKNYSKIIN